MADNDKELSAKIAALAGRINQAKQGAIASQQPPAYHHHSNSSYAYSRGRGRGTSNWTPQRGTPYGVRGRGGHPYAPVHRHRTLVLKNDAGKPTNTTGEASASPSPASPGNGWIAKRDRHMQLINTAVYDKVTQQRVQSLAETAEQRRRQRNRREVDKLQKVFAAGSTPYHQTAQGATAQPAHGQEHEIVIANLRFRVTDGGSKLIRVPGDNTDPKATPRLTKIGGVSFYRSKHGNLYRAGLVRGRRKTVKKVAALCPRFTTTGTCPNGPNCRFTHDPAKVVICKDFLAKGTCPLGPACDLSHEPTPHRVPACTHFLRGNCTNEHCRYAHVRVNPSAPVCRAFGRLGFCEKGAACTERHVFECPDYANKGLCRKPHCRLPHVDRAGQLRKAASSAESGEQGEESSDISSDEESGDDDDDDVDSDEFEEDVYMLGGDGGANSSSQELARQQDFVPLS